MRLSRKLNVVSILALMALSSAVYAQSADGAAGKSHAGMSNMQKSSVSTADQKMMAQLAQANMAEIAVGQLAQTKSTDEQILKFSRQMVDDHSQALKDVSKLAEDKNVKLPTAADAKHQSELKKMQAMNAAQFDREYARQAVKDHEDAQNLIAQTSSKAKDADLKALAEKMAPTINMHLKMARELKPK